MTKCDKSADGRHCYHSPNEHPYMASFPPKEPICCHCGAKQSDEHGPFYQRPASGRYPQVWYASVNG